MTKEMIDLLAHDWMKARLEGFALFGIGEDFGGDALTLGWIGNQSVNDIIGVDRFDAEFVQVFRDERLPARDTAGEGDALIHLTTG